MCLLATQPEGTVFSDEFLKGVYRKNGDGIGVMYSENNRLFIRRALPKNENEFISFFREHIDGKNCVWHARMKTHGNIDLQNCHPYMVLGTDSGYPIYMAHNGVLSTGNSDDVTKSDTWHYINKYIAPMLKGNPTFFLTDAFKDLIEEHIGSANKFVLMDAYGNIVTLNEKAGVKHNGAWLSNTYAWDTTGTEHEYVYGRRGGRSSSFPKGGYYSGLYGGYNGYGGLYGGFDDTGSCDPWDNFIDRGHQQKSKEKTLEEDHPSSAKSCAKDGEVPAETEFAIEFFLTLRETGYFDAHDALRFDDAERLYKKLGHDMSKELLSLFNMGGFDDDDEVLKWVRGFITSAETTDSGIIIPESKIISLPLNT